MDTIRRVGEEFDFLKERDLLINIENQPYLSQTKVVAYIKKLEERTNTKPKKR
jgi:hypothetical protein